MLVAEDSCPDCDSLMAIHAMTYDDGALEVDVGAIVDVVFRRSAEP
jgi:hypothetical protein